MKCKVCGAESGQYPLCRTCNARKERGEIIKCSLCGQWHHSNAPCASQSTFSHNSADSTGGYLYELKKQLVTHAEQSFFEAIQEAVPTGYHVFPQINLAAFIFSTNNSRFHNELFRNVDFLITDEQYHPKIVIEINDRTHLSADRRERDEKVRKICEEAGIPIVNLWTSYGVNKEYIRSKISETLEKLPIPRIKHSAETSPSAKPEDPTNHSRQTTSSRRQNGCYVATCVYGSYDCPQVWVLRRYRDNKLAQTLLGRMFIRFYYAISPTLVNWFGQTEWFCRTCKGILDKMITSLKNKGYADTPYYDN